ncbi:hypothetical protein H2201_008765 [Coniosporium apollinis]|uniref:CCHC-type domain-containing protein n=1 Tax=Coniosporium apollinis TaxID=61459 RepID=A0ABQ9NHB2_9PEZI|nr:hypothetical protein H2201_008765 [Coniosporium apollinis]
MAAPTAPRTSRTRKDTSSSRPASNPFDALAVEPSGRPDEKFEQLVELIKALDAQVKQLTDSNEQVVESNMELARKYYAISLVNEDLVRSFDQPADRCGELTEINEGLVKSNEELVKCNGELVKSNEQLVDSNTELKNRVHKLETTQNSKLSAQTGSWRTAVLSSPGAASFPTTISPNSSASQPKQKETLPGADIDLSNLRTHLDTENSAEIKRTIQAALVAHVETKDIACTAVLRLGREKRHFRILFATDEAAQTARVHAQWVESHLNGTRLRGEAWFPVKVDRVDIGQLTDETRTHPRNDACTTIGRENGVEVRKITPLGPIDPNKHHCSVVLHLAKQEDVDCLLSRRVMEIGGEVAFPKPYVHRDHPTRCFNCYQYGHQQARCKNPTRCGHCAAEGHHKNQCTSTDTKCAACGGPRSASDKGCKVYRAEAAKMR